MFNGEKKSMEAARLIIILANGEIDDTATAARLVASGAIVIAADGGARHAASLGRPPDVLIGDLDSLPDGYETGAAMDVLRYPADKNETDLELALLYAANRYPEAQVIVLGGFGGRLDHTLANILLLAHPHLRGRPIRFVEGRESVRLITGRAIIAGQAGDIVSLLPVGGPARVVETTGLRWPLRDETLAVGPARGVSNEMTAARATITLRDGLLLCIHTAMQ
jgi:thiamine pyrophosphokinase